MSGRGKIIIGGCLFTLMFAFWSIATGRSIGDLRSSSDCGVETVFQDGATIVVAVTNPGAASLQKGDEIRLISNFPERSPREFFQGPVNLPSGENLTLVIRRNDTLSSAVITTAPIPFKGWMTMAGALIGPWTFLIIGLLILLLRQADEQAWLLAMMLGTFSGLFGTGLQDGDMVVLVFSGLARAAGFVFTPIFLNFFLLFPARSSVLDRFKSLERWIYFPFLYILIPVFVVARIGPLNEHLFSRIPEGFFKAFNVFILALSLAYIVAAGEGGTFAPLAELIALSKVVAAHDGLAQFVGCQRGQLRNGSRCGELPALPG